MRDRHQHLLVVYSSSNMEERDCGEVYFYDVALRRPILRIIDEDYLNYIWPHNNAEENDGSDFCTFKHKCYSINFAEVRKENKLVTFSRHREAYPFNIIETDKAPLASSIKPQARPSKISYAK